MSQEISRIKRIICFLLRQTLEPVLFFVFFFQKEKKVRKKKQKQKQNVVATVVHTPSILTSIVGSPFLVNAVGP